MRRFGLAVFERRADDGGEIADVLCHQEIVAHEALGRALAFAREIAEPGGNRLLKVEAQALLGAAGHEMQMAAHRHQEFFAAAEKRKLPRRENACGDQIFRVAHPRDVFGDPEQRVEIAQAAFALLDVGLDEVAGFAGALDAVVAFLELGGDEFHRRLGNDFLVEALLQALEQRGVAEQQPRLEDGGADGHVRLGALEALLQRARGVPDLLLEVPQSVQRAFHHLFGAAGLGFDHEQQVDVRARRQQPAAISADGQRGESSRGEVKTLFARRQIQHRPQQLIFGGAEVGGAGDALAAGVERGLGGLSPLLEEGTQNVAVVLRLGLGQQLFQIGGALDGSLRLEAAAAGGGPQRRRTFLAGEAHFAAPATLRSITFQIAAARSAPPSRLITLKPVGEVTLISVR